MPRYAAQTEVSSEKSRQEIERTLRKYGASAFQYGWQGVMAVIAFVINNRAVRITVEMPDRQDKQFTHTPGRGYERSDSDAEKAWEQATRQRWRALALVVKAKLEAVESGISTFDNEFLAFMVVPGTGKTVGELAKPQLQAAYEKGGTNGLLLLPSGQ
jgi:hypothetical protein